MHKSVITNPITTDADLAEYYVTSARTRVADSDSGLYSSQFQTTNETYITSAMRLVDVGSVLFESELLQDKNFSGYKCFIGKSHMIHLETRNLNNIEVEITSYNNL